MELFMIGLLAVIGAVFGLLGTVLSIVCMIKTIAAEKSTHKIVYHDPFAKDRDEEDVEIPLAPDASYRDEEDPWQTSDEELEELNKKVKEADLF